MTLQILRQSLRRIGREKHEVVRTRGNTFPRNNKNKKGDITVMKNLEKMIQQKKELSNRITEEIKKGNFPTEMIELRNELSKRINDKILGR